MTFGRTRWNTRLRRVRSKPFSFFLKRELMKNKLAFADDRFHDECGVFGAFGHEEAAKLAYLGLYALQHRGQESAGIVTSDGNDLHGHMGMGLVSQVFNARMFREELLGHAAIGHVSYSTTT